MTAILFFTEKCPDTAPFVAQLKTLNISYTPVDILENTGTLKQFLKLRDKHPAFNTTKANEKIGIPALHIGEKVIVDMNELSSLVK
ncbi:hypothetical protein F9B74_07235 [Pelistega sp. NLN82]|uniref:Glutaredoxin-related protein n=1 Tax=Pelistega ratti TaxID=2652177 RepID=A0A6L9Y8Q9_9BURK|nr:hypothetical protein [Pelistega ratti]NEN76114.1 hypothetical protein [Pelistega ratti]